MSEVLLEAKDVRVTFGGVRALDGLSIQVEAGSCCGIIGPNGSGKTTFLGVITRLTKLTSGSVVFGGVDYSSKEPSQAARLGIARTFQTVRLIPTLDVMRNVMIGAASEAAARNPLLNALNPVRALRDDRGARATAEAALERVGMLEHRSSSPQDLPYGLQRRVEIARALATKPRMLLLDEPMAGMTHTERDGIANLLRDLRKDGLTQILIEHDLAMIHRTCDTCYALDFGKVIASGASRDVAAQPVVREAYLGHQAMASEG